MSFPLPLPSSTAHQREMNTLSYHIPNQPFHPLWDDVHCTRVETVSVGAAILTTTVIGSRRVTTRRGRPGRCSTQH